MSGVWPPAGTLPLPIDVVSVQSQVVYGRVGNNVALPTLAAYGLSTAAVPTVTLSNTPHYASLHGGATPDAWVAGWLDDLVARGSLERLRAVQSGYLGSAGQAQILAGWLRARLAARPDLRVIVDPVIGDHDQGVYVDPALVDSLRSALLPLADGLTPNDFELAHLTGRPVGDLAATVAAAQSLLTGRTQWVAVTSAVPSAWAAGTMELVLVLRTGVHVLTHPHIDTGPKGTGDLFAAALVANWLRGVALPEAVALACQRVIDGLRMTRHAHCAELLLPPASRTTAHPDVVLRSVTP